MIFCCKCAAQTIYCHHYNFYDGVDYKRDKDGDITSATIKPSIDSLFQISSDKPLLKTTKVKTEINTDSSFFYDPYGTPYNPVTKMTFPKNALVSVFTSAFISNSAYWLSCINNEVVTRRRYYMIPSDASVTVAPMSGYDTILAFLNSLPRNTIIK